jgi:hypothetical protein
VAARQRGAGPFLCQRLYGNVTKGHDDELEAVVGGANDDRAPRGEAVGKHRIMKMAGLQTHAGPGSLLPFYHPHLRAHYRGQPQARQGPETPAPLLRQHRDLSASPDLGSNIGLRDHAGVRGGWGVGGLTTVFLLK